MNAHGAQTMQRIARERVTIYNTKKKFAVIQNNYRGRIEF